MGEVIELQPKQKCRHDCDVTINQPGRCIICCTCHELVDPIEYLGMLSSDYKYYSTLLSEIARLDEELELKKAALDKLNSQLEKRKPGLAKHIK